MFPIIIIANILNCVVTISQDENQSKEKAVDNQCLNEFEA